MAHSKALKSFLLVFQKLSTSKMNHRLNSSKNEYSGMKNPTRNPTLRRLRPEIPPSQRHYHAIPADLPRLSRRGRWRLSRRHRQGAPVHRRLVNQTQDAPLKGRLRRSRTIPSPAASLSGNGAQGQKAHKAEDRDPPRPLRTR